MHTRLIWGDGLRDELRSYSIATGVASRYSSTFTLKISWSRVFSYQILFSSPKMIQIFASEFSKTSRLNVSWMSLIFADQRFIGVSFGNFRSAVGIMFARRAYRSRNRQFTGWKPFRRRSRMQRLPSSAVSPFTGSLLPILKVG